MIKRILVGLGGTPYTPVAIKQAVELAAPREAELTGVTLVDVRRAALVDQTPPESGVQIDSQLAPYRDAERRIERSIAKFHEVAERAGVIRRNVVRETEEPFSKFIDLARYHDLMVCGLRKLLRYEFASGAPHDLLIRFMTSGVQPVLSVAEEPRTVKRALIAFSGSAESTRAMKRFVQLRLFPGVAIRVVSFGREETARPLVEAAAEYCRAHGYAVNAHPNPMAPKDGLLAEADEFAADVIVLGHSARKTLLRRMLGDTTLHVIANAKVPLFICQ